MFILMLILWPELPISGYFRGFCSVSTLGGLFAMTAVILRCVYESFLSGGQKKPDILGISSPWDILWIFVSICVGFCATPMVLCLLTATAMYFGLLSLAG